MMRHPTGTWRVAAALLATAMFALGACTNSRDRAQPDRRVARDAAGAPTFDAGARIPEPVPKTTLASPTTPPSTPAAPPVLERLFAEPAASGPASHGGGTPPVVARLEVPRLGLAQPVYDGDDLTTVAFGPTHITRTPMPGHEGNSVVVGHRVTHSRPFYDIDKIRAGDEIVVQAEGERYVYTVTEHRVVSPGDAWVEARTAEPSLTLYACHPKGTSLQRYVIRARLTSGAVHRPPAAPAPSPPEPSPAPSPPTTAPRPVSVPQCPAGICLSR